MFITTLNLERRLSREKSNKRQLRSAAVDDAAWLKTLTANNNSTIVYRRSNTGEHKICVTVHRCLQRKVPNYLTDCCTPVSDIASQRHLRLTSRHHLSVPCYRHTTFGRRAFSVTGPTVWNSLLSAAAAASGKDGLVQQSLSTLSAVVMTLCYINIRSVA